MTPPGEDRAPRKASEDHDPGPPPIQFGLKALLTATTIAALLFAVLSRVSGVWAAVVVWLSLLVAGHVLGNVMGTRAAAHVSGRRRDESELSTHTAEPIDPHRAAAPTTPLGANAGLGLRVFILVGAGAVVGSLAGTAVLWIHNDRRLDLPALALAAFSSAVVGAFFTFLGTTCAQVISRAFRHASDHAARK